MARILSGNSETPREEGMLGRPGEGASVESRQCQRAAAAQGADTALGCGTQGQRGAQLTEQRQRAHSKAMRKNCFILKESKCCNPFIKEKHTA